MKKVALFGGTFNPPHLGHIHLALQMKERFNLDEVIWIPTSQSPFKTGNELVPFDQRFEMCKRAITGIEGFSVDDLESKRPAPAFTIDTVNEIIKKRGPLELYLILGQDQLKTFDKWKNVDELLSKATPLIGVRAASVGIDEAPISNKYKNLITKNLVQIPLIDISSTQIRDRLKKGLSCGHLLPSSTLDYIQQNHLYY